MENNCQIEVYVETQEWHENVPDVVGVTKKVVVDTLIESGVIEQIKNIEVAITLAFDEFIQDLNKRFRKKDKPTNVLSFPNTDISPKTYKKYTKGVMLGDVIISFDTVLKEAKKQGKSLEDHLKHMIIHGILHLLGFDHENEKDAKKMETLEINLLKRYNIPNPYIIE